MKCAFCSLLKEIINAVMQPLLTLDRSNGYGYGNTYEIPKSNTSTNDNGNGNSKDVELGLKKSERKMGKIADTLERFTRMFLPLAFLVFNSAYWPWLINGSSIKPKDTGGMYEVSNPF